MIILDIEQNTPEWRSARLSKPTASAFNRIVTTTGKRSKSRKDYLYDLVGERVTGESKDNYSNGHMERGHERQDESLEAYEFINNVEVIRPGFCYFDEKKEFGCSPDGLVGEDGGFETKDAIPRIHIKRQEDGFGKEHFQQVQGCLYVTGRKWWDLVSYSRGFKPLITRFSRDEVFIKILAIEIKMFLNDLNEIVEKYSA